MRNWIVGAWLVGCSGDTAPVGGDTLVEIPVEDSTEVDEAVCGDGIVAASEVCDDGNVDGGDYCSEDCQQTGEIALISPNEVWALRLDGVLETGSLARPGLVDLQPDPEGRLMLALGEHCAIDNATGEMVAAPGVAVPAGAIEDCSVNGPGACAILLTGELACVGAPAAGVPVGPYRDVAVSATGNACGVDDTRTLRCWGPKYGDVQLQPTPFDSVVGGTASEFCGVTAGRVWCSPTPGQSYAGKDLVQAAVGSGFHCGLHEDGRLECEAEGVVALDREGVVQVVAYADKRCVLTTDGAVSCERRGR